MGTSSLNWLPEMVVEDSDLIHQSEYLSIEGYFDSPSCFEGLVDNSMIEGFEAHAVEHTLNGFSCSTLMGGFENYIAGVEEVNEETKSSLPHDTEWNFDNSLLKGEEKASFKVGKSPSYAQSHAIIERKRREILNKHFIALSSIIPGLKKTDKASLVGDATNYIKELEAKVKTLEEEDKRRVIEHPYTDDNTVSSSTATRIPSTNIVPALEIEARMAKDAVVVRAHFARRKGVLAKLISEVEKLHLVVVVVNAFPFADSSLDVTMVAKIKEGVTTTMKDLEKSLRSAFN